MRRFLLLGCLILAALVLVAADLETRRPGLIAHEWGTFTSVAGEDGRPAGWFPLNGPTDLPCFVHRLMPLDLSPKIGVATVRMETPVIYFYADRPSTVSVRVDFRQGLITEWYPRASKIARATELRKIAEGRAEWNNLEIRPGDPGPFPQESRPNHYYAARETDAASVIAGGEREKLIFYRGIGDFHIPIRALPEYEGKIEVLNDGEPLAAMILFENHGGKTGYRVVRGPEKSLAFQLTELSGGTVELMDELRGILVSQGLYGKEARAMVETWRDSWFEEGRRIFYIVPRRMVDRVLPLEIQPAPAQTDRVFVGRIELLAPWMEQEIGTAVSNQNTAALAKYGRFLDPFFRQMQQRRSISWSPIVGRAIAEHVRALPQCAK